jgi:NAD(P) transhydrogenase subunit alpha
MRIGIPKEVNPLERRVACTPKIAKRLIEAGFEVGVEWGAGDASEHLDAEYIQAGAEMVDGPAAVWGESDIILRVNPPTIHPDLGLHEAELIREGACLIGFISPAQNGETLEKLAARGVSTIAMDCVPRITRAQKVDALSAMANAAGYRAVIEAARAYPRFFTGQTTAAGTIDPAKVLVIGAGVAGLAAIGAAKGLGGIVRAFDTRSEVGDQVRSMGAEFLEVSVKEEGAGAGGYARVMSQAFIDAEMKLFAQQAMEVNIIITTALIPGREAPKLISSGMVESMAEGSVIVDLAAANGGNCALTKPGEMIVHKGVRIIGYTDLPSRMALQTSWLYGTTLYNMLEEMGGAEGFKIDLENDIVRPSLVTHGGEVTWPPPQAPAAPAPEQRSDSISEAPPPTPEEAAVAAKRRATGPYWLLVAGAAVIGVGWAAPESFLSHLTVFVLACFVGWQVVWNVTPALHTPLMSVTNAISGIIVIGGMLHLSGPIASPGAILGLIAVLIASINIAGGFLVTRRMLAMFHR